MDMRLWAQIQHFTPRETWGDLDLLKFELVQRLDWFRAKIGHPIHINCAADLTGHTPNSYHYKGMAADIHCYDKMPLADFALAAIRMGFGGVGVYPMWQTPGLHVDIRSSHAWEPNAAWICWRKGKYLVLDANELSLVHCRALRQECLLLSKDGGDA